MVDCWVWAKMNWAAQKMDDWLDMTNELQAVNLHQFAPKKLNNLSREQISSFLGLCLKSEHRLLFFVVEVNIEHFHILATDVQVLTPDFDIFQIFSIEFSVFFTNFQTFAPDAVPLPTGALR